MSTGQTTRNEAAKRLRSGITANKYLYPQDEKAFLADLDEALATERRNFVEQVRATLPDWFPCRCHEAYSKRHMEDPDCPTHDIERWLDSIATGTEEGK